MDFNEIFIETIYDYANEILINNTRLLVYISLYK